MGWKGLVAFAWRFMGFNCVLFWYTSLQNPGERIYLPGLKDLEASNVSGVHSSVHTCTGVTLFKMGVMGFFHYL